MRAGGRAEPEPSPGGERREERGSSSRPDSELLGATTARGPDAGGTLPRAGTAAGKLERVGSPAGSATEARRPVSRAAVSRLRSRMLRTLAPSVVAPAEAAPG